MKKLASLILVAVGMLATSIAVADKVPKADIVYAVDYSSDSEFIAPIVIKASSREFAQKGEVILYAVADLQEQRQLSYRRSWHENLQEANCNSGLFNTFTAVNRVNPQSLILLC